MQFLKWIFLVWALSHVLLANYNDYYKKLEEELLVKSPSILMQKYLALSAKSKQFADFMLPDATVGYTLMGGGYEVMVSQMIPFPSKMISKSKQLRSHYKASQENYRLLKAEVRAQLQLHYMRLYFLESKVSILSNHLSIIEQLESQINSQVISGKASTEKLLSIQIERETLRDTLQRANAQQDNAIEDILFLLEDTISKQALLQSIDDVRFNTNALTISEADIQSLAKTSAIYKKKWFEKEEVKYIKQLKWNALAPDVLLRGAYGQITPLEADSDQTVALEDHFQINVSLQVPITVFKRTSALSEIENRYQAHAAELEHTYRALVKNIKIIIKNHAMNANSLNTYKNTLKKTAEQHFVDTQSQYITSKNTSSIDFLESFRKLLDIDLMILRYQVDIENNRIMLEKVTTKHASKLEPFINPE